MTMMRDRADSNPITMDIENSLDELDNELKNIFASNPQRERTGPDNDEDDHSVDLEKLQKELHGVKASADSPQTVSNVPMDNQALDFPELTEEVVVDENTDLEKLQSDLNNKAAAALTTESAAQNRLLQSHKHQDDLLVKEVDASDSSFSSGSTENDDVVLRIHNNKDEGCANVPTTLQFEKDHVQEVENGDDSSFSSDDGDYSLSNEDGKLPQQQWETEANRASSGLRQDGSDLIDEVSDGDNSTFSSEEDFVDEDDGAGMEEGLLLTEEDLYSDEQYQVKVRPDPPAFSSVQAALLAGRRFGRKNPAVLELAYDDEYGPASQLPSVEEYKATMGKRPISADPENPCETNHEFWGSRIKPNRVCFWRTFTICVIFVLIPSILVPTLVAQKKQSRIEEVMDFLSVNKISEMSDLQTPGSPQNMAAIWVADDDHPQATISMAHSFLDRYVLAVVFFALGGTTSLADSLNFLQSEHVCNWEKPFTDTKGNDLTFGVHGCRLVDDELVPVGLTLAHHELKGEIPDELKYLNELESLVLQYTPSFGGSFPSSIRSLTKLHNLSLEHCLLSGELPAWIGELTDMTGLGLGGNKFEGRIPDSLTDLSNLKALGLDDNAFKGELEIFKALTNLEYLYLNRNEFEGKLFPFLFEKWTQLIELDLGGNQISGYIPDEAFSHDKLKVLDLHGNRFTGPVPNVNVELNDNLEHVALHENELTGEIPSTISFLAGLTHLDVSDNILEGTLPNAIGNMMNLRYLFVGGNDLDIADYLPLFITEMEALEGLSLANTGLIGPLPEEIGLLSNLSYLDLSNNQLSGMIPENFGLLTSLRYLLLRENRLSEPLPDSFSGLADLELLLLDGNDMTGDMDVVCSSSSRDNLLTFASDCGGEDAPVQCSCCTVCCNDEDSDCEKVAWEGSMDPKVEYDYKRGGGGSFVHGMLFDGGSL